MREKQWEKVIKGEEREREREREMKPSEKKPNQGEIRRHNCGPGHGLNEDYGAYVRTTMWNPVFHTRDNG